MENERVPDVLAGPWPAPNAEPPAIPMPERKVTGRAVTVGGWTFDRAAYTQVDTGRILGGVTRQHIANMIEEGELRAIRLGRRVLVPATEIARLLSEASTEGGAR